MEALYLSQISSSIGSLSFSIESFPENVPVSSFLQFKPIFHPVLSLTDIKNNPFPFVFCTTTSQSITILPFSLCFCGVKASFFSSSLWVHILQTFEYLVCSSLGHLPCMCICLVEHAQSKPQCLNLALLVLDCAMSHLKFLAAICIHTANDGVCLTPCPDSVDLCSTLTPLYCCLIACPPWLILSAQWYL